MKIKLLFQPFKEIYIVYVVIDTKKYTSYDNIGSIMYGEKEEEYLYIVDKKAILNKRLLSKISSFINKLNKRMKENEKN